MTSLLRLNDVVTVKILDLYEMLDISDFKERQINYTN